MSRKELLASNKIDQLFLSFLLVIKLSTAQNCVAPPTTILTATSGEITQPPWPDPIWAGTNCGDFFWTVQAPGPCDTITWTMESHSLFPGLDRVEVFDGTYPGGTNVGNYAGTLLAADPMKPVVTSTGKTLTVWFNTTNYPGSSINFFSNYQINPMTCSTTSTSSTQAPNPLNPDSESSCSLTPKTKCWVQKYKLIKSWPYYEPVFYCMDKSKINKKNKGKTSKFLCDKQVTITKLPLIIVLIYKLAYCLVESGII